MAAERVAEVAFTPVVRAVANKWERIRAAAWAIAVTEAEATMAAVTAAVAAAMVVAVTAVAVAMAVAAMAAAITVVTTVVAATAAAITTAVVTAAEAVTTAAVGTTTTRTLEHIAQQAGSGNEAAPVPIEPHSGSTAIFIGPGYRFRMVKGLLTNFHLPESTLLMLVCAFAAGGDAERGMRTVLTAYAHAIREGYRFYSYGDCMLLL